MGRIATIDGKTEQNIWDGDECNKIQGTDSTIFPPFMTKEQGLWTFTPDICRSIAAHYVKKSTYAGMPTSLYSLDLGDLKVHWIKKLTFKSTKMSFLIKSLFN